MADDPKDSESYSQRDSETFYLLGTFICALAIPVFIGTFYADKYHAQVVNVMASVALFLIGLAFFLRGWFYTKRVRKERDADLRDLDRQS